MKKITVFFLILAVFVTNFTLFADDDDKLQLAVMEFEDRSGKIPKQTLSDATEYVRASIISSNTYIVISKERQEQEMIKEMKKESYKACNDKNCQIPLGQALSADTIMRTTITYFGGVYTISSELIDLAKEATIIGAKKNYKGSEEEMREALDYIVEKIISTYQTMLSAEEEARNKETRAAQEAEKSRLEEEKRKSETEKNISAAKLRDDGKVYRDAGISVLVIGSSLGIIATFIGPIAGEYDEDARRNGLAYNLKTASAKGILSLGIITIAGSIAGGTYLLVKGQKMQKEAEYIELNNVSVLPTKGGAYASLGFSF